MIAILEAGSVAQRLEQGTHNALHLFGSDPQTPVIPSKTWVCWCPLVTAKQVSGTKADEQSADAPTTPASVAANTPHVCNVPVTPIATVDDLEQFKVAREVRVLIVRGWKKGKQTPLFTPWYKQKKPGWNPDQWTGSEAIFFLSAFESVRACRMESFCTSSRTANLKSVVIAMTTAASPTHAAKSRIGETTPHTRRYNGQWNSNRKSPPTPLRLKVVRC